MEYNVFSHVYGGSEVSKRLCKRVEKGVMTGIRAYSMNDDFVDFVVYVRERDKDAALAAIRRASDRYWDESDEGYYSNGYLDTVDEELSSIRDVSGTKYYHILTEQDCDRLEDYELLPYSEAVEF